MKKLSLLLVAVATMSACTWVKPTEQAKSVAVANAANVRGCALLREVSVSVTAKLGPILRNDEKVATELATLARNEATTFAGDTVVPITAVENGHQSFNVYKCNKK